jgi:hypothetical protein
MIEKQTSPADDSTGPVFFEDSLLVAGEGFEPSTFGL